MMTAPDPSPESIVRNWTARVLANADRVAAIGARCRLVVSGEGGGAWVFACRTPVAVLEDKGASPVDCTIAVSSGDLVRWAQGDLNPQVAFMERRLTVSGDGMVALRLAEFLRTV